MTEPLDVLIQAALMAQLTAAPRILPTGQTASPLVNFAPTEGTPYIDARPVMRAASQHMGIAFTDSEVNRGIFQVDAVTPDNQGEAPGLRLASQIAARFAMGTELALAIAGAVPLKLQFLKSPTIAAAVKDTPWIRFPVSIPYLVIS